MDVARSMELGCDDIMEAHGIEMLVEKGDSAMEHQDDDENVGGVTSLGDKQHRHQQHSTSAKDLCVLSTERGTDTKESVVELNSLKSFNKTGLSSKDAKLSKQQSNKEYDTSNPPSVEKFMLDFVLDWCFSLFLGFLVVSYWRGTWTLLDIWSCNQPASSSMIDGQVFCFVGLQGEESVYNNIRLKSAWHSLLAGYSLLAVGLYAMNRGWWQPANLRAFMYGNDPSVRSTISAIHSDNTTAFRVTPVRTVIRLAMVYLLGNGTVCLWRGIWYLLDAHVFPDDLLKSFWTTTVTGFLLCFSLCSGASLLAPPAIFLLDGPSGTAPPLASTILMSYRSVTLPVGEDYVLNERDSMFVVLVDMALSYLVLPWGVVGFWRGLWSLMDHYLWGFTAEDEDLHVSIWISLAIGTFCLFSVSEDIMQLLLFDKSRFSPLFSSIASETLGRVRTIVLAVGAVNFWRTFWYIWDEWLGGTSVWSAALSHVLSVAGLFSIGCLSCIAAPPATMGVDATAHPCCADEPLFYNAPVPHEALSGCAMGRSPDRILRSPASVEIFLPPPVSERLATSLRNVDSRYNPQSREESITLESLSLRHQSFRKGSDFFRNR